MSHGNEIPDQVRNDNGINLADYGWNSFYADAKNSSENSHLEHGRIVSVHKSKYEVVINSGIFSCEILGNLQFQKNPLDKPAVGDWVLLDEEAGTKLIVEILARKSLIKRQKKHDNFPKPIAANIDRGIVVQAIGPDFNIKRLERILIHIIDAGVEPMIIINKIDLADGELDDIKLAIKKLNYNIDILYTSYITGEGIDELAEKLTPGETVIFIGSSGVGKSSIINSMLGHAKQATREITDKTGKGKHTTTARRLILLDNAVLVIDTPGTREFGMHSDDNAAIKQSFDYIENVALGCQFGNCGHSNESGCAIRHALENGDIDTDNYKRYLVLQIESEQSAKQMRQAGKVSSKVHAGQPLRSARRGKSKPKKRK
ncbi:MAG: ribosome small subunit-dependent GTPase A [Candidatus Pacebacteria bacterium]|nr:ribosome small subunit-dependent GTPase A [Candidatus Paceibacterota bacterium]